MSNFNTRKLFLLPSFDLEVKEEEKLLRFLSVLHKSGIEDLFSRRDSGDYSKGGRPGYSYHNLMATVLYGFAYGNATLRDLETACKFDLRYIYLMDQERPSHMVFGNFINEVVLPNRDEIFNRIMIAILNECNLRIEDAFIDGSKFEADANKYKFVWKPTKFHQKLSDKIRALLEKNGLARSVPTKGIINSKLIAIKVSELSKLAEDDDIYEKDYKLLCDFLIKSLEYEEKEEICGEGRNSYFKTDHDATAMCLKEDYYSGLGSNMHAAYNVQLLVSSRLICMYYVSSSRTDTKDFIPVLKRFYDCYRFYPERICADSGYGSLDNYMFLSENEIGNYVKYFSWESNVTGRNPDCYHIQEDESIICLNGNTGHETLCNERHPRYANSVFYKVEGCNSCTFKDYCKRFMKKKDEDFKIFEVVKELQFYKEEAFDNLLSPKGIELRINRSSQVEGAYGVVKQDMNYTRLRRVSIEKVETEFMLTFLGYNIRKLFRFFEGKAKFTYWYKR